tara:strand:- start:1852 stop:2940 length:1089 start_codon:yes stop_codon:yes gene_type:complete
MNKKNNEIYDDDSIDLIELLSKIWKGKIFIVKTTIFFTLIGIIYSLSLKNVYTASSEFYPQYQSSELSQNQGLRGLAGLAGINLGSIQNSEIIPPTLYPNIIRSTEFKINILDSEINYNGNILTYREYLLSKNNIFSLKKILTYPLTLISKSIKMNIIESKIEGNNTLQLSKEEYNLHENLLNKIFLELNSKEGFIKLSVKDNDPLIASQIAKISNELLQKNIIDFKIKNIKDIYEFISSQLEIAKNNFYNLQDSLATFNDRNINIKSDLFLNQYSRIESEYLIAKNIYNELAINKEKTAIEVKKNTPIFTIIEPVVVPNEKSDPKRSVIVITFSFIGLLISSFYILTKSNLLYVWNSINRK